MVGAGLLLLAMPAQACFSWSVTANDRYNGVEPGMFTEYVIMVEMSPGCRSNYWLSFSSDGGAPGWTDSVLDETGHPIPMDGTEFFLSGTVTYYFTYMITAPSNAGDQEDANFVLHIFATDKYNEEETKDVETITTAHRSDSPAPDPVELADPDPGVNWVNLAWDQTTTWLDFARYEVHMSHAADFVPIPEEEAQTWVANINNRDTLAYNVSGLAEGSTYYFQVRVVDSQGEGSGGPYYVDSNEEYGRTTGVNYKPEAVTISNEYMDLTNESVKIEWSKNEDVDFAYYDIHAGRNVDFSPTKFTSRVKFYERNITSADIQGLDENQDIYLKIRVYDNGNPAKFNDSNELKITTLDYNPLPSDLLDAVNVTYHEVELEWTENINTDFDYYEIHYSTEEGFDPTVDTWDQDVLDRRDNVTMVTGLEDDTTYYFKVRSIDNGTNHADSNEIEVTTPALNKPPVPAELYEPEDADISDTWVKLTWSENEEEDFDCYEIYMSEDEDFDIDDDGEFVDEEDSASRTSYKVRDLDPSTTYYFKIRTWDEGDEEEEQDPLSSDSNEVDVTTEPLPTPVVVSDPTSITHNSMKITWSRNTDDDFRQYEVYMDTFSGFNPDVKSAEVKLTDSYTTEYTARDLDERAEYYFIVRVVDQGYSESDSNSVMGETLNGPPAAVDLDNPFSITTDSFTIHWEPSEAEDFAYYEIHTSEEEDFTPDDDTLVETEYDVDSTTYTLEDLKSDTEYFVCIRTYDEGGLHNDSNMENEDTEPSGSSGDDDDDSPGVGFLAAILATMVAVVATRRRR